MLADPLPTVPHTLALERGSGRGAGEVTRTPNLCGPAQALTRIFGSAMNKHLNKRLGEIIFTKY